MKYPSLKIERKYKKSNISQERIEKMPFGDKFPYWMTCSNMFSN